MKSINIVNGPQNVSAIIQGCMRMPGLSKEDAAKVIRTGYDCGINFSITPHATVRTALPNPSLPKHFLLPD